MMKVRCIDDGIYGVTLNKLYYVTSTVKDDKNSNIIYYYLIRDDGKKRMMKSTLFISLEDERENKINNILKIIN